MEYFSLEKYFFKSNNIIIEDMVNNISNESYVQRLNKKELQIFWEIKPILNVFENINYLEKIANSLDDKYFYHKDYSYFLENIEKVLENYLFINNLKLNTKIIIKQLISALLLITFNDKFITEKEENSYLFINKYKLINKTVDNLKKFVIFFDENNLYNINSKKNKRQQKILLDNVINILVANKEIIQKNETKKDENNGHITTQSFFSLNNSELKYSTNNICLRVYFEKLKIINYDNNNYYKSYHFLSVSEIYRPNPASQKFFEINKDLNLLSDLNNMQYWLDYKMFEKIYNKIIEEEELNSFKDSEIESVIYKKYLDFLKNINISYTAQKECSKYQNILVFLYLKKYKTLFKEPFYLSYYFDFRGRLYSDSIISPIGFKWFRYLYNYGKYQTHELNNFEYSNENHFNIYYESIIKKTDIKTKFENLKNLNVEKYILVTCFFEIGKIYKSKYLDFYNNKINYANFIEIGIIEYNKKLNQKLSLKDDLELIYILNILESWNENLFLKFIIWKDATASAIQLQTIIFESTNNNNYYYTNLIDDSYWHDTYFYIIEKFFKEMKNKDIILKIIEKINNNRKKSYQLKEKKLTKKNFKKELKLIDINTLVYEKKYFNRSTLKKTIMTFNYSATILTCYKEFLFELKLEKEKYSQFLFDEFQIFYNYLEILFNDGEFFKKTEQSKINDKLSDMFKQNMFLLLTPDLSKISYDYYKKETERKEKQIKKQRFTTTFVEYSWELDEAKIKQSFKPNYIHSLDATLVRIILKLFGRAIITIHDSFGVDILNINRLIKIVIIAANEINKESSIKINSFFIIL